MSTISSINGYGASAMSGASGGMPRMQRPDPSKMADALFSKLDTKNQGYLEKSDLQTAFDQLPSTGASGDSASVDEVFESLDGDGNGKITKDEMSSSLQKLAAQLDGQFNKMREGGMPPPPPEGASDSGYTKDQLTSMASEIGATDSKRSSLMSSLAANFEQADTDKDGKISAKEAMAYDQTTSSSGSASSTGVSSSSAESSDSTQIEAQIMRQIMELMRAYGGSASEGAASGLIASA